ncbi:MAG: NAD(P)/FAD-dependent oxidoreductase [Rhodospirillaceae bacterium]|jgi:phytoene dehydrogenase-like protein|nr:NAD(P)/FAD-dependent oxidoreductase [Rhodospirillaceae bacterium]MBT3493537.1 NAD(P)/FAD-dependent oxidoreductase [Rhodospirillaceae bacterium]MBT3779052.1 NAD(P)/FAD-dependent oxidoreductase [Rhodospirillaceae bacterium]MBT3976876.1 NAD(P)/FAD-dependent oxidoreductase [Rhodospirillaceae bacterium]MBT4168247.1 NAD(P)/FAD-dependent oxidoreductase [Rhodospirillaceae bacterium]
MAQAGAHSERYDVVVVGAGHNGLVCAAYLARGGLSVKVLERRAQVGGAAVTEEFHPGFRNSVASYAVGLLNRQVVEDLDLFGHGLELRQWEMSNFLPLEDGDFLKSYPDMERTRQQIARISSRDAEQLADYEATIGRLADVLRGFLMETPPNSGGGLRDLWGLLRAGRRLHHLDLETQQDLADIMVMSAVDFLGRWFETDAVKSLFAYDGIIGTFASPYSPGTAYVLLHHCFGDIMPEPGAWGHAVGGMGAVTQAMAKAAEAAGVVIETGAAVAEVEVSGKHTNGVRLADGRLIGARAVAANVNPKLLFLDLLAKDNVEPAFRRRMANWRCKSGTLRMNVALSELPDFTCLPGNDMAEHHQGGIIIGPSTRYLDDAYADAMRFGWSRRPFVELVIPSTIDPSLAPKGQHVASMFCQQFDPDLPDGQNWDQVREQAADDAVEAVTAFAPNFRDSIIARQILTPLDLEREFGLIGGDIFHGTLDLNQLYSLRPTLGHADYRMPIQGLYLCGSGAHPGGGVTGIPGHNAAREIIRDIG